MADTTNKQAEQTHMPEEPGTEIPASDEQTDFEELKEASRQFFTTLVRVGIHLARTPVSQLPEESREHFTNAVSEFTEGSRHLHTNSPALLRRFPKKCACMGNRTREQDVR